MSRMLLAGLALGATVLAASGCGGSSKAGSATTTAAPTTATAANQATPPLPTKSSVKLASGRPLTRTEWLAKGDAICARTNTKVSAISAPVSAYATTFPQIAIYKRIEAEELSKLVSPRSMTHDWAQIIQGLALDSEYINAATRYLQAKNHNAGYATVKKAILLHSRLDKIAAQDGFGECSRERVQR